jgi:hypothetical protein
MYLSLASSTLYVRVCVSVVNNCMHANEGPSNSNIPPTRATYGSRWSVVPLQIDDEITIAWAKKESRACRVQLLDAACLAFQKTRNNVFLFSFFSSLSPSSRFRWELNEPPGRPSERSQEHYTPMRRLARCPCNRLRLLMQAPCHPLTIWFLVLHIETHIYIELVLIRGYLAARVLIFAC